MRRLARLLFTLSGFVAVESSAHATRPAKCHLGSDYLVVTRDRTGETGEDILVRPKPEKTEPCRYVAKPGDYLPKVEAAYFVAVSGRFLALDIGTGPDRSLFIYDVAARRKVFGRAYDDARKLKTTPDGFVFWDVGAKPIKPATCPKEWRKDPDNALAASAHASREILFAFKDGKPRETGRASCMRTQEDM